MRDKPFRFLLFMDFFILEMKNIDRVDERMLMMPSLHILDQVAIPKGQTAQETLIHTTQLAQLAEVLGMSVIGLLNTTAQEGSLVQHLKY